MNARFLFVVGIFAAALLPACSLPPKIMVSHQFRGVEKTSKLLIMATGQINPATKAALFDVFMRMCDLDAQGNEAACKDTKVIENIVPGSVY